jgi:conjugative relaxase-like TrwC/TraI family protein
MLSIGKLAAGPGAGRYYVDQVAQGREDYYAGEGEAAGVWLGGGAASLGLSREVSEHGLMRLLEGRDPASGTVLRDLRAPDAIAGFDLTFRAPKSVSILFGIGEPGVAAQITRAHEAAVAEAMAYLERDACVTRRGRGGAIRMPGRGFVAAAFRHRSSRAGDPLLHTHVVVANATQGKDGRWTALDGRELYRHAKTAGFLYQAALRAELSRDLGLRWQAVENGTADVEGVPRGVIEHFSRRRGEILELMAARGETSARAAQVATLETRRRKEYGVPVDRLREQWRARAAEHGLGRVALSRILRPSPERRLDESDLGERLEGPDGLTRHASTFTRRDVLQAFAEHARDGATVASIQSQADAFLARDGIVELEPLACDRRYSTRELLQIEHTAIEQAQRPRPAPAAVPEAALATALANRPSITADQQALVTALIRSERGLEVVRAPAGTGKTFALDAAREAWQAGGVPVIGCALSAKAAGGLRDQADIDTTTIARLTYALDHGARLAHGSVLVVDEAGMVGTRDLARLLEAAEHAQARLVLVGDDRQLPEIQAGGLFSELADRLGAIELTQVRRQREAWDRKALAALRDGDVDRFADAYHEHGRIVAAPTAEAARERLVADWLASHNRGERAVMLAHRRRDVADLNERARRALRERGKIGDDQLTARGRSFAVGDRVVARRNDRRLGIVNGDTGRVAAIDDHVVTLALADDRTVRVPESYVCAGHLEHGYALTAHLAQGATVDRAFILGSDELYREWGYTALSRHREEARFYVSATPAFLNESRTPLETGVGTARSVSRVLRASRAQRLALDGVRTDPVRDLLVDSLKQAKGELAAIDDRVAELDTALDGLRWYERTARRELERRIEVGSRQCEHWRGETQRLAHEIDARPARVPSACSRAIDPLAGLEPRTHELDRQRDLGLER